MRSSCWKSKCWKFLSAFFSRLFFAVHGFSVIATLAMTVPNAGYMYLNCIILLLFIEMVITLAVTEKGEWKWFSPMVFIYLCSVIPPIFIMELNVIDYGLQESNTTNTSDVKQQLIKEYSVQLLIMEQFLILVLVIGRWLMPKGNLNREQLSQLLLIYLGLGADILDILQVMKEKTVQTQRTVAIVGLCLFCWAITQFTFVLTHNETAPKSQKTSVTEESLSFSDIKTRKRSLCSSNEVQSFLITIGMIDGPLLAFRVYVIIVIGEVTDSIVFFICKNVLTLIIETYRLLVFLCKDRWDREKNEQHV